MLDRSHILVTDFQGGSDLAFTELYHTYKRDIYLFCLKFLGDTAAAKDIVQQVFLKAYERRSQLTRPGSFKAWLLMIARNDCLTHLRQVRRMVAIPEEGDDPVFSLPPNDDDDSEETITLISRAIARLKPELREIVVLREYENLSYNEIAEVIGITEGLVKSRLFTARRQLCELLKPMFADRRQ